MSTVRKIGKNISFLGAANIIQKFLALAMVIYLAQKLGVGDFGVYSFAFSFVLFFSILGDLGIQTMLSREIAKDRSKAPQLLGDALVVKLILFLPVLFLVFISISYLHFFNPLQHPWIIIVFVFLAGVSLLLDSMASLFRMIFFAFQEMKYEFCASSFYKIILVSFTLGVLFLGFGLKEVFFVAVFSSFMNFSFSFVLVIKKFAKPKISFDFSRYKRLIVSALPFCFLGIGMVLHASVDSVMLSFFKGNLSVGYYSAAMRLISTLGFIPVTFMSAVFPVMASFYASSNKSLTILISKSFKYLLIIILPIAFITTLLSGRIIELIYPTTELNNFAPAATALKILVWFSVLNFLNMVFLNSLVFTDFEKKGFLIVGVSLALNIILNFFLIPMYDFEGAAFASVLSQILFFVLGAYFISRHFFSRMSFFKSIIKISIKPLIGSLVIFLFVWFFFFLNFFVLVLFSAIIYLVVLFLIKGFDKQDISFFRKILSK